MNSFDISHRVEAVCVRCVLGTCSGRCKVLLLLFKSHKSLTQKGPSCSLVQAVLAPSDTTLPKQHFPKSPPSTAVGNPQLWWGRGRMAGCNRKVPKLWHLNKTFTLGILSPMFMKIIYTCSFSLSLSHTHQRYNCRLSNVTHENSLDRYWLPLKSWIVPCFTNCNSGKQGCGDINVCNSVYSTTVLFERSFSWITHSWALWKMVKPFQLKRDSEQIDGISSEMWSDYSATLLPCAGSLHSSLVTQVKSISFQWRLPI